MKQRYFQHGCGQCTLDRLEGSTSTVPACMIMNKHIYTGLLSTHLGDALEEEFVLTKVLVRGGNQRALQEKNLCLLSRQLLKCLRRHVVHRIACSHFRVDRFKQSAPSFMLMPEYNGINHVF